MITSNPASHIEPAQVTYRRATATNRIGLWLFIASDALLFVALLIARFYLLGPSVRPEADALLGLAVTSMLLVSSFFANRAEIAIRYGDMKEFSRSMLITMALGTLFLLGVVGVEWQIAPHGPSYSTVYSLFFTMTGFHAFHVLTGLIFLGIVYRNARKGLYGPQRHWPVEAAAVYWHFIDLVWIFFYPALYLIGHPPL